VWRLGKRTFGKIKGSKAGYLVLGFVDGTLVTTNLVDTMDTLEY
jgi:hypothetical protein